jgi:hypothetical protein
VTATGEYKNIGLPRMKQIAAHCSGNVQATELVTVSGRQEGNKLKVLLAMTYGSPFTWACTGPGAKLIKPPYPFDFLSTVRRNYAASCPGAGDPNFAINLTLV